MKTVWSDLETLIYYEGVFGNRFKKLPGTELDKLLAERTDSTDLFLLRSKLSASCRKMIMMWLAGERAIETESEFYSTTYRDSPALFGDEAVNLHYHLESFVLFARSSLDIAAYVFGELLPKPFERKRYDSFNDLIKKITATTEITFLSNTFIALRDDPYSWLNFVADVQKGRSLRDKLAHQIGFPIGYEELHSTSEKESAVVYFGQKEFLPLPQFVDTLREGVISGFILLEESCLESR